MKNLIVIFCASFALASCGDENWGIRLDSKDDLPPNAAIAGPPKDMGNGVIREYYYDPTDPSYPRIIYYVDFCYTDFTDNDGDGFDDNTGLSEEDYNEKQSLAQAVWGSIVGTGQYALDPNGNWTGSQILNNSSELPPDAKWVRDNTLYGVRVYMDEEGNLYLVPIGR